MSKSSSYFRPQTQELVHRLLEQAEAFCWLGGLSRF